jgi:RNA polymerase sigma-70 factor (ECF subfamily)
MSKETSFAGLMARVREGDQQAAEQLVRSYEPALRLVVRRRLSDPSLRRLLDSQDICQSILGRFFVRVALGEYTLETPEQLMKLLITMALNEVCNQADKAKAARRDCRRVLHRGEPNDLVDPGPSPSNQVATQDLLQEMRRRLSPEELRLVDLRYQGYSWEEIAAQVGSHPDAVRMRFGRALTRALGELGLADERVTE